MLICFYNKFIPQSFIVLVSSVIYIIIYISYILYIYIYIYIKI